MNESLTRLHRFLLWFTIFPGIVFAVGFVLAPVEFQAVLGLPAPDVAAIRAIGGFLFGSIMGAALSLRSNKWSEVWITTAYLATWNIINTVGLTFGILTGSASPALLPNTVITFVCGFGFAYVLWQRRSVRATQRQIQEV